MTHIALTGGIASGKSAVADLLAAKGAVLVDSDVLARETPEADALEAHLAWLRQEQDRLARQIASVATTIRALRGEEQVMVEKMGKGTSQIRRKSEYSCIHMISSDIETNRCFPRKACHGTSHMRKTFQALLLFQLMCGTCHRSLIIPSIQFTST